MSEQQKVNLPSLSISNTLMASCGVRFLNSLAGSVCRLCRRGLTTLTGILRKKGLRNGEPLTCCVMMPEYNTGGSDDFSGLFSYSVFFSSRYLQNIFCTDAIYVVKVCQEKSTLTLCLVQSFNCNITHLTRLDADHCVSLGLCSSSVFCLISHCEVVISK